MKGAEYRGDWMGEMDNVPQLAKNDRHAQKQKALIPGKSAAEPIPKAITDDNDVRVIDNPACCIA